MDIEELKKCILYKTKEEYEVLRNKLISEKGYNYFREMQNKVFKFLNYYY